MQIDIWSDVRCPFCFIAKKKFEAAMAQFEHADKINVVWHSYELDPTLVVHKEIDYVNHFSETKGVSKEEALGMFGHVISMGKDVGIDFNLETAIVANSFNAHRLTHLAKEEGKESEMVSAMFEAHFLKGENIDDNATLLKIADRVGLDNSRAQEVIDSDEFSDDVRYEERQASEIGIRGVPFFILDEKYSISGAQPTATFLRALKLSYGEFVEEQEGE